MNAFETLGVAERLELTEGELRDAFREAGKRVHPDAGGAEGEFAALREASATLSNPSRRLRHWLELRGETVEIRGTIGAELMDLFAAVGAATQRAEALIRKRDEAKSALGRALLEGETQASRDAVEEALQQVESAIVIVCGHFPAIEKGDFNGTGQMVRDLSFLEKWKLGLRSIYGRLI